MDGRAAVARLADVPAPEVSFVIPCLNEESSIAAVVAEARRQLERMDVDGEVVVVDNASEDASAERATEAGARVVAEPRRGYGSAYLAGLAAAEGRFIVMTDADGSYDLTRVPEFVDALRNGAELVLGSRAIRKDAVDRLDLETTGMEFASEMVIKAAKRDLRITEIPVDYRPRTGESKLNSVRDAWRHVRFMLVHSANWLFVVPGAVAVVVGLATLVPFAADRDLGDPSWAVPVSILASFLVVVGAQVIQLGLFARTYAALYLGEEEPFLEAMWRRFRLEHGLALGAATLIVGVVLALVSNFDGVPDPSLGLLGLTLIALGAEAIFGSFFLSILGLSEHARLRRFARDG